MPLITEIDAKSLPCLSLLPLPRRGRRRESSLRDGIGREVIKWTGRPVARVHRSCARIPLTEKRARKSSWRACESCGAHAYARVCSRQRKSKEWDGRYNPEGEQARNLRGFCLSLSLSSYLSLSFCRGALAMKRGVTRVGERITAKEQCLFKCYLCEMVSSITDLRYQATNRFFFYNICHVSSALGGSLSR